MTRVLGFSRWCSNAGVCGCSDCPVKFQVVETRQCRTTELVSSNYFLAFHNYSYRSTWNLNDSSTGDIRSYSSENAGGGQEDELSAGEYCSSILFVLKTKGKPEKIKSLDRELLYCINYPGVLLFAGFTFIWPLKTNSTSGSSSSSPSSEILASASGNWPQVSRACFAVISRMNSA